MTTRALVLGGGGTVGIAWEIGVVNGLHAAGLDVSTADLIIGTSAGSVVGTQLALGLPIRDLLAEQTAPAESATDRPVVIDQAFFGRISAHMAQPCNQAMLAGLGQLALQAPTESETAYLERFAALYNVPWPERRLLITAFDTADGRFQVWDGQGAASLQQAVASSCAVPGIFPPVSIGEGRYMDGGMRSGTNADLALGYEIVLIMRPIGGESGVTRASTRQEIDAEIAALQAAGSRVYELGPDTEALAAMGLNLMDSTRRGPAAEAGVRQGRAAAEAIAEIWR